jgi:drug/metabolite transporter (DMT)-like permease
MFYLLLVPFFYAYQNVAARYLQRVDLNLYAVGGFTYLCSALIYGALFAVQSPPLEPLILYAGIGLGILYAATFLLFVPTLADRGVSVMAALCQLSALFPMAATIVIWHEQPSLLRWIGAVLCLIAMPMLGLDRGVTDTCLTCRKVAVFAGMVVLNGGVLLGFKWFEQLGRPEQFNGLMVVNFGTATVIMALLWPVYHGVASRPVIAWGLVSGVCYAGAALFLVQALRFYEGAVVFPFAEATAVALTVGFAALVWREIPGRWGQAGIAVVTVAAVLINL